MLLALTLSAQDLDSLYTKYKLTKDKKEKTNALLAYGHNLLRQDIDSALACGKMILLNATLLKDKNLIAEAHLLMGFSYEAKAEYKAALQNYIIANNIFIKSNNKKKLATCNTAMGVVYWYQGLLDKAVEYYKRNLIICNEINDKIGLASSYGNLAIICDQKKEFNNSLNYYTKAMEIFEAEKDQNQTAACLDNMSLVYKQQGNYKLALEYNLKSYKIRDNAYDTLGMLASMENLGSIFIALKKYDAAISISNRVLTIATRLGSKEDMKASYINLKDAYESKNDLKNANLILNKLMEVKDSLMDIDNANQISELETKFKIKEKEKELSEVKIIQVLKEKESFDKIKKRNYFIIILMFIGVLILALAALLLKRFKDKKEIAEKFELKNQEIQNQKTLIDKAYHLLTEKNKDITDSIKYAKRIQEAIFLSTKTIHSILPSSFVLFKPKDIVSGDFYWIEKTADNAFYIAVVDCTGHGVPGAFMSIVGINLLNKAIHEHKCNTPADILYQMNYDLTETLKQKFDETAVKDGMEISLCKWDKLKNEFTFAGANSDIYHVSDNVIHTIKGNKQAIGSFFGEELKPFTNINIKVNKDDCIYLFSDGYADQFGGPKGKKFKYKQFEDLLLLNSKKPINEQKEMLYKSFETWRVNLEQVDDVCVLGIKI